MKIRYVALTIMLLISSAAWAFEVPDVFPRGAFPGPLELLDATGLSNADEHLAAIIQGMANRERPRVYVVYGPELERGSSVWLAYYRTEYGIPTAGTITLGEAVARYGRLFKGYALFSFDESWTVNVADTYCSINDCLPVSADQEAIAVKLGLPRLDDFRGRWKGPEPAVLWSFRELYPRCSHQVVAAVKPPWNRARDYFYAHRIFCFHFKPRGREFIELWNFLKLLPPNIPVMGYFARTGYEELNAEVALARTGKFLVPSDGIGNLTVHSGIPMQPLPLKPVTVTPPDLHGKLGVVLAFSDGDNIITEASIYVQPDHWLDPRRGEIKAAWSFSPMLYELAPGIARYYYQTKTDNDAFVPFGGAGYAFPSIYKDPADYGKLTLDFMELGGLDSIWTIDANFYVAPIGWNVKKLFQPFDHDPRLRGALFGYLPSGGFRYWQGVSGYPPLLYNKLSLLTTDPKKIARKLRRESWSVPPRGRIILCCLNNWRVHYAEVVEIAELLHDRENIVFITPDEAFSVLNTWRSKN